MKRSSIVVAVLLFIFLGVVAAGLTLVKRGMIAEAANQPAMEPPNAVLIDTARSIEWFPTNELVGTVIALRSVSIQNEVEGVVTQVGFNSGDIVEAGQMLITIDDRTDRAELMTAQAALRFAEAEVQVIDTRIQLAESEYKRQMSASESRATSELEVDRARAEVERTKAERVRAEASIEEAKARIQEVQTRLDKHIIRAPFRGRVGLRSIHPGQFLAQPFNMDSVPITTLQEVADTIHIDFPIPQEYIDRVEVGMVVQARRENTSGPAENLTLTVSAIDAVVNNNTRNVRVRSTVDNRDGRLRPGMFIKIRVPVEAPQKYVVAPVNAVRRASYADQVFTLEPAGEMATPDGHKIPQFRARQRFVKLGPSVGSDIIVLEGLKEGEQIAASGAFKLFENALVIPGMPPSPEGGPPPGGQPPADAPQNAAGEGAVPPAPAAPQTQSGTPEAPTEPARAQSGGG